MTLFIPYIVAASEFLGKKKKKEKQQQKVVGNYIWKSNDISLPLQKRNRINVSLFYVLPACIHKSKKL